MQGVLTRPSDVDIHAVSIDLPLWRRRGHGGNAQVSGVQVLLCPLPVIRLVIRVWQHCLLLKLRETAEDELPEKLRAAMRGPEGPSAPSVTNPGAAQAGNVAEGLP